MLHQINRELEARARRGEGFVLKGLLSELYVLTAQAYLSHLRQQLISNYPDRIQIEQEGTIAKSCCLFFTMFYGCQGHKDQGSSQTVNCKVCFDRNTGKMCVTSSKVPSGSESRAYRLDQLGEIQSAEQLVEDVIVRGSVQPSYLDHFKQMIEFHLMTRDFGQHPLVLELEQRENSIEIVMPEFNLAILIEVADLWGHLKLSFISNSPKGKKVFGQEIAAIL